jgi:hypothetical protein
MRLLVCLLLLWCPLAAGTNVRCSRVDTLRMYTTTPGSSKALGLLNGVRGTPQYSLRRGTAITDARRIARASEPNEAVTTVPAAERKEDH